MTEADWNACTYPTQMVEFLDGEANARKLRLFAVACCRRVWHLLVDKRSRVAVETAERFADGMATQDELNDANDSSYEAWEVGTEIACAASGATILRDDFAYVPAYWAAQYAYLGLLDSSEHAGIKEPAAQAHLARCIFGPLPFRPVTLNPAWFTLAVTQLAEGIYEEKAFDRMPVLGDALEEAGCTDIEILNHCRQSGEHVRGCWVIDLLLGKS